MAPIIAVSADTGSLTPTLTDTADRAVSAALSESLSAAPATVSTA